MVPPLQSSIWTDIVTGKRPVTSSKLAINLMTKNVQMHYAFDTSPESVRSLVQRVHEFFTTTSAFSPRNSNGFSS